MNSSVSRFVIACVVCASAVSVCTARYVAPDESWKKYHVTGWANKLDCNKGLIYDARDTELEFTFVDENGNQAHAPFKLHLSTLGPCISLSIKWHFVKLAGSHLSLYTAANGRIKIGMGLFLEDQIIHGIFIPWTLYLIGSGIHIAGLDKGGGALVIIGPHFIFSEGAGLILGGYLEMIEKPEFDTEPAPDTAACIAACKAS